MARDESVATVFGIDTGLALEPATFIILYRRGEEGVWQKEKVLKSWGELFCYGPELAAWFSRHHRASYLQYDHGEGNHWRCERHPVVEPTSDPFAIDVPEWMPILRPRRRQSEHYARLTKGLPDKIPGRLLAPHARRIQTNHGQTLERLAERGGLGVEEIVAALQDRTLFPMLTLSESVAFLQKVLAEDAEK